MSLSDRLKDAGSPVRAFLQGISPQLMALHGPTSSARAMAVTLGLSDLAKSTPLVSAPKTVDAATTGTAVDVRTRIALSGFDARASSSFAGVSSLIAEVDHIENGRHRAAILAESFVLAESLLLGTTDEADLDLAAVLFAYCEQIFRVGIRALNGALGEACDQAQDATAFANNIAPEMLADVRALMNASAVQLGSWKAQILDGERFEPNPDFAGSLLVDGADGDWLIGETLIDCKVYGQLSTHKLRNFLLQLLGYVMLDLDDALKIRHIGLWLPRQQLTPTWSLEYLLARDPEEALPQLRDEFIKATNPTQLALHIPVTQRRKHQLLAENPHTRPGLLDALANSDDKDIRFRVGRNQATPTATVRTLATDRYARVREGVAMNARLPADVLDMLSRDSSKVVRRAATASRGPSRHPANALTSGVNRNQSDAVATISDDVSTGSAHASDRRLIELKQDRAEWSLDTMWLTAFLSSVLRSDTDCPTSFPVPEASRTWSYISGRPFHIPQQLRAGLSDAVNADLLRDDRPAPVRRLIARNLPLSDIEVRTRLLNDEDAEIRWSTLQRSVAQTDDALSELLGKLAGSREARLCFRKDETTASHWGPTPAELDQQVLQLIARHPSTPQQALQALIVDSPPETLICLAQNPGLEAGDRDALIHKMMATRSHTARALFASSVHTPPEVLTALASSRVVDVRAALAHNPNSPPKTLTALSMDRDRAVRLAVLQNDATPERIATSIAKDLMVNSTDQELLEVLDTLERRTEVELPKAVIENALDDLSKSRSREPDMRFEVGSDVRAGERTLKRLAKSADNDVRQAVAGNPSSPSAVIDLLTTDLIAAVRASAAGNEVTAVSTLIELAQDDDAVVRLEAAKNPHLSQEALRALLADDDPRVRRAATENPSAHALDVHQGGLERQQKSNHSRLTRSDLEEMAAHRRAETRIQVAFNGNTPSDILRFLGGDRRSVKVRRAVAAHPNTPAEVLWSLASDKDLETHQVVALNASTPVELLVELTGRSIDFALLVSLNPAVPDEVLGALATDVEPLVKFVADLIRVERTLTAGAAALQLPAAAEDDV